MTPRRDIPDAPSPTANSLTRAVIEYIRYIGGLAWRNNTGAYEAESWGKDGNRKRRFIRYGEKGSGDVFAVFRGRFYSIEIKVGRDTLKPVQQEWMDKVNEQGGVAFVARSLDDVTERIYQ